VKGRHVLSPSQHTDARSAKSAPNRRACLRRNRGAGLTTRIDRLALEEHWNTDDSFFNATLAQIEEPVTKLGGLPVWVDEPTWPVSAATGQQMLFIGQVVIDQRLFPVKTSRIAYLFITQETETNAGQLGTWDPKSGEMQSSSKTHRLVVSLPSSTVRA